MTAQGILGEVLDIGYCLHTPTSGELAAGDALDAGTVQIVDSNFSHLARENLHHLVTAFGPGVGINNDPAGFTSLLDSGAPTTTTAVDSISWSPAVAQRFGPFDLTSDRIAAAGNMPRKIRVRVDRVGAVSTSLILYAAITPDDSIPTEPTVLAWSRSAVSSGRGRTEITLSPARHAMRSQRSRSSPAEVSVWSAIYLWVGWYATDAADAVISISAWELR